MPNISEKDIQISPRSLNQPFIARKIMKKVIYKDSLYDNARELYKKVNEYNPFDPQKNLTKLS